MKVINRSRQSEQKIPTTHMHQLLDNQMTLFVRSWGSQDYNQKLIDEISHYMSSAQADLEVTTPFDFQENLSSLANRTRISFLLAHDYFYKNENKSEYSVGFEAVVFFQLKNELAWSSVGRFGLKKINEDHVNCLFENGTDLDQQVLLPAELIGLEGDIDIRSGSMVFQKNDILVLSSTFQTDLTILSNQAGEPTVQANNPNSTYWYSVLVGE